MLAQLATAKGTELITYILDIISACIIIGVHGLMINMPQVHQVQSVLGLPGTSCRGSPVPLHIISSVRPCWLFVLGYIDLINLMSEHQSYT